LTLEAIELFDQRAAEYDAWFSSPQGSRLFQVELATLRLLLVDAPRPLVDIGCGTGTFSAALGIDLGVDPSIGVLALARLRHLECLQATAEALPLADMSFGTALLNLTLCFIADPAAALGEVHRILKPGGVVVIGELNRQSAWGEEYLRRKREGDPFYSAASFFSPAEASGLLRRAGLEPEAYASSLRQPPGQDVRPEEPLPQLLPDAGFVCIRARKV